MLVRQSAIFAQAKAKIGVVRLWPDKAAAEHENIERIRLAAARIGIDVIEVDRNGYRVDSPGTPVDSTMVDFVLNLHYATPKNYDAYSYGALWNPPDLYFEWGFEHYLNNQLTHDAYVSPGATAAEDLIVRCRPGEFARGSFPLLNHTLAEPIIPPRITSDRRLFYCGVNWEVVATRSGRHASLLQRLDAAGRIEIYGPEKVEGIAPWAGYRNYRGQLPFDGVSLIETVARAGAALVFSSDMHKRSGIMSNRLFEAAAGGALIIADGHPFVRTHFGDCVLSVDDTEPAERQCEAIVAHLDWANSHPAEAVALAARAQERLLDRFRLDEQLAALYRHHFSTARGPLHPRAETTGEFLSILLVPVSFDHAIDQVWISGLARQTSDRFEVVAAFANANQAEATKTALAAYLPASRFRLVDVGRLARAPIGNFGAMIGMLVDAAAGSVMLPTRGHEHFSSSLVAATLSAFAREAGSTAVSTILIRHRHPVSREPLTDLYVTQRRGPHPGAVSAVQFRRGDYQKHRPLLDYLGAELWSRTLFGGLLGPVFPVYVPQILCELNRFESDVFALTEAPALVSAANGISLLGSYVPPGGGFLPAGVAAIVSPVVTYSDVFDPQRYAGLPLKQRQKFGGVILRALLLPRFIQRFFQEGGRFERLLRRALPRRQAGP